jgi:1-acyl-sn-glycerol-3-phosphate acyltransferase
VKSDENLQELKSPLIIVVNHTCWADPFIAGMIFPFKSKACPIYYATLAGYYYFPLFFPFFIAIATFPVRVGAGLDNNLKTAIRILENGWTIGIFPEGRRRRFGRPRRGKRGAAYLALKTGTSIMPIEIKGALGLSPSKFFFKRPKITIRVKKIFTIPSDKRYPEDLNETSDLIMDRLRAR